MHSLTTVDKNGYREYESYSYGATRSKRYPDENQCFEYDYDRESLMRSNNNANADCSFRSCALFTVIILGVEVFVVILVVLFSDDAVKVPLNQSYFERNYVNFLIEYPDNMTINDFLLRYNEECQPPSQQQQSALLLESTTKSVSLVLPKNNHYQTTTTYQPRFCPCISPLLKGYINLTLPIQVPSDYETPQIGGIWKPKICQARQRVAIIIPFLDRHAHLDIFLKVIHPLLQRQLLDYQIFVIEQSWPNRFNKAAIMNAGFDHIEKQGLKFDCIIFHDVDMLPEDDRNMYACHKHVRHIGTHLEKWNYTVGYRQIFGGAVSLSSQQFKQANGYSNEFWGWGGEDDDFFKRIIAQQLTVVRYPRVASSYQMIKHDRDKRNPSYQFGYLANRWRPLKYRQDGLNTVKYVAQRIQLKVNYTLIVIKILNQQIGN